jgi:predicted ATPase
MKLQIRNIGKIESADLKLDGITVIAGNNNTGKSTVGKVVFSLYNSLFHVKEKLDKQKEKLVYQMLQRKIHELTTNGDKYFVVKAQEHTLQMCATELSKTDRSEEQQRLIKMILNQYSNSDDKDAYEDIFKEYRVIKELPDERLERSLITAYYSDVFNGQINNAYAPTEKASVTAEIKGNEINMVFQDNICTELTRQCEILNEAIYLDNPFVLDSLNNGIYGANVTVQAVRKKLTKKIDVDEDVVQQNYMEDKIAEILAEINKVSSGSISYGDSHVYLYKEDEMKVNVNNLSAGLKSFVIIKTLLENGALKEKDVLILDEPEIHLHPEWQMIYAEVIVLLQKIFDLTIIMTTHSAHFIQALQYYAKKHGLAEKCSYYLALSEKDGCRMKDVSGNITEIYSQLVEPSIILDRLRYDMEDEDDE